jgi:hypothetical protein
MSVYWMRMGIAVALVGSGALSVESLRVAHAETTDDGSGDDDDAAGSDGHSGNSGDDDSNGGSASGDDSSASGGTGASGASGGDSSGSGDDSGASSDSDSGNSSDSGQVTYALDSNSNIRSIAIHGSSGSTTTDQVQAAKDTVTLDASGGSEHLSFVLESDGGVSVSGACNQKWSSVQDFLAATPPGPLSGSTRQEFLDNQSLLRKVQNTPAQIVVQSVAAGTAGPNTTPPPASKTDCLFNGLGLGVYGIGTQLVCTGCVFAVAAAVETKGGVASTNATALGACGACVAAGGATMDKLKSVITSCF